MLLLMTADLIHSWISHVRTAPGRNGTARELFAAAVIGYIAACRIWLMAVKIAMS